MTQQQVQKFINNENKNVKYWIVRAYNSKCQQETDFCVAAINEAQRKLAWWQSYPNNETELYDQTTHLTSVTRV